MPILPCQPAPVEPRPALVIRTAALDENVAELRGNVLTVDPTAPADDQLDAIADAVQFLRTGRVSWGRRARHLRAVSA